MAQKLREHEELGRRWLSGVTNAAGFQRTRKQVETWCHSVLASFLIPIASLYAVVSPTSLSKVIPIWDVMIFCT